MNKITRYFLTILCFGFFMILAAGSGCDGCQSRYIDTNFEEDSIATEEPVTPLHIEEDENTYSADVEEDEREEEETYQSESEDDDVVEEVETTETEEADSTQV